MTINEILPILLSGARVTRDAWSKGYHIVYSPEDDRIAEEIITEDISYKMRTNAASDPIFSIDDIRGDDWDVFETDEDYK